MVGLPYDDLDGWRGPSSREQFVGQFQKLGSGWAEGLKYFEELLDRVGPSFEKTAKADFGLAKAAFLHFRSVALQGEFIMKREDRKSTRLNTSHVAISYAVFCLKKKKIIT